MTHIAHCLRSPSGTTVETTYNYPAPASVKSVDLGQDSERTAVVRPTTTSRYQLWPSSRVTSPGPERPRALTTGRASSSLSDTAVDKGAESMFTKNTSFTGRRKHGLPEIHAGAMTTVHELPIDSPTIPGRPPMYRTFTEPTRPQGHERSNSAPGSTWASTVSPFGDANSSLQTPTSAPYRHIAFSKALPPVAESGKPSTKVVRKPTRALSPILSPTNTPNPSKCSPLAMGLDSPQLTPPAVPPKSPPGSRYSPGSSSIASTVPSYATHSASSSTSTTATSFSTLAPLPATTFVPERPSTAGRRSPTVAQNAGRQSPVRTKTSISDLRSAAERGRSSATEKLSPSSATAPGFGTTTTTNTTSGSRARSRSEQARVAVAEQPRLDTWKLPTGLRREEALQKLPETEQDKIRTHARLQAERFEILDLKKVSDLSKELRALDERCDYLRNTWKSLRSERHKLHDRLVSYLRNDSFNFSRENILRQEETLLELDKSADDWIYKLEQAENRRLRLRQKLLEHLAGSLTLYSFPNAQNQAASTPPGSPIRGLTPVQTERRDVESIKVYADGQVLDLFTDIEKAIGKMCEPMLG